MNLVTLVSSLVLAASTATAGLLVVPSTHDLPTQPQDGPGAHLEGLGLCVGVCSGSAQDDGSNGQDPASGSDDGSGTSDNSTGSPDNSTTPPADNQTVPPSDNETAPPAGNQTAPPPKTCGIDLYDSMDVEGPSHGSWTWQVGSATRNLTVSFYADGMWLPLGGGVHATLVDGDGRTVASAQDSGMGLPFDDVMIDYQGTAAHGLSHGQWSLQFDGDGLAGSASIHVHSDC